MLSDKDWNLLSNHLVTVTNNPSHPDLITHESGPYPLRAILPCNHAISSSSLTNYVLNYVTKPKAEDIPCPSCNKILSLEVVKYVGNFKDQEWKMITDKLNDVKFARSRIHHRCPGCFHWCQRIHEQYQTVHCSKCYFSFCINCNMKHQLGINLAGQTFAHGCSYLEQHISQPTTMKQIENQTGYKVRKCPDCKLLIEHKDACKHMTCVNCRCQFCFICLGKYANWGAHRSEMCALAPVQS